MATHPPANGTEVPAHSVDTSSATAAAVVVAGAAVSGGAPADPAASSDAVRAQQQRDVAMVVAATASVNEALTAAKQSIYRLCGFCGRAGAVARCSRCLSTYYCAAQCQSSDWKKHKSVCIKADNPIAAAAALAGASVKGGAVSIPANSAAVMPPPSSTSSTRSSVASSIASSMHASKEVSTMAGTAGHAHSHGDSGMAHSHSHGGGNASGHSHSHGPSAGHNHSAATGHSHSHAPSAAASHSHSCVNPKCPHKAAEVAAKASGSSQHATARLPPPAPASSDSLPAAPLTATQLASSSSAASSVAPAASSSSSAAAASASASTALPAPVHSQTSYSPVPISNVSASTRHIYVPPCRPLLRPNFLSFPYAATPPLSCINGFHTNLLFSATDPVRILYADLGDVRHVLHALIDLHAKMKAWRKKVNSAADKGDKKAAARDARPNAEGLPLPPAPLASSAGAAAAAAAKNPNIGIEFHLNDANPHVLARSVLFLVSTYVSSACMNVSQAIQSAASYGMPVPSAPYTLAQHVSSPGYTPSALSAAALCLSSYRPWTPQDHWCFLFCLYGNYQMPLQFIRRTAETLQLLVRLTGGKLRREDNLNSGSGSETAPSSATSGSGSGGLDSSFFSQHPYTFFLHLPSIALALLLPIWRNWEDVCHRAIVHAEAAATSSFPASPSPFHLPPVDHPMFPPADVAVAHPHDADVCAQLNHFYKHGCAALNAASFGSGGHSSKSRAEMAEAEAARKKAEQTAAVVSESKDVPAAAAAAPAVSSSASPISELYPPCTEEYFDVSSYVLNPTVFPCNFSSASLHFSAYSPAAATAAAAAASAAAVASSAAPSAPLVAANLLSEVSQRYCFAREPFSPLLSRLSSGSSAASGGKDKDKDAAASGGGGGGLLHAALEVMSKTSHALFWVVQFPQSAAGAAAAALSKPATAGSAAAAAAAAAVVPSKSSLSPSSLRCPFVRLYFYPHDVYFHLHTYDFLWDRILVYHMPDYSGLQSLILMARPRMKNAEAILETAMNFPSCLPTINGSNSTALTTGANGSAAAAAAASSSALVPDLHKFCLLSLNANPKLIRNIFGWDMHIYSYPVPAPVAGATLQRATSVVRMQLCEYSLDISAPAGHISDGFRVLNDWLMTSIQPILLHDEFSTMHATPSDNTAGGGGGGSGSTAAVVSSGSSSPQMDLLRNSTPRSSCNLRTFCLLVGLLIKQGHLDQAISRQRILTLFATIFTPHSAYQMDHLFTNLLTHIGLLKSELLPLMYLLLSPTEDSVPSSLHHNTLFFKGLWQLELVSMKFEPLLHAWQALQQQTLAAQGAMVSQSYASGSGGATISRTKLAQQSKITSKPKDGALAEWDPACRLCMLAGPNHCHHQQHAAGGAAAAASASVASGGSAGSKGSSSSDFGGLGKEPLLSLLFVTLPSACPTPAAAASAAAPSSSTPSTPTSSTAPPSSPLVPGSVPFDSPLSWVNHRELSMLRWLRETGRSAQLLDVVDIDWSTGVVTAWINRTYVHYVRKCSHFAQVCLVDFERLAVVAPPRSVVHLKTIRSVNIR